MVQGWESLILVTFCCKDTTPTHRFALLSVRKRESRPEQKEPKRSVYELSDGSFGDEPLTQAQGFRGAATKAQVQPRIFSRLGPCTRYPQFFSVQKVSAHLKQQPLTAEGNVASVHLQQTSPRLWLLAAWKLFDPLLPKTSCGLALLHVAWPRCPLTAPVRATS